MFAILLTLAGALAPRPDGGFSLDFESLAGGHMPAGWEQEGWGFEEGYRANVSNEGAFDGQYCLRLDYGGEAEPVGRGTVTHRLDAKPYLDKRVAFSAMVRVVDPGCEAWLMLRGVSKKGASSLVAGHFHEPIRSTEWARYEIVGDVEDLAELEIGLVSRGRGRVLVDDLELRALGDLPSVDLLPPKELGEDELTNLLVLGRLVGLLRYYHPSDQAAEADWGAVARAAVVAVEDASGTIELSERLETFFAPLAPTIRVFTKGRQAGKGSPWADPPEGDASVVRWEHRGLGEAGGGSAERFASERVPHEFEGRVPPGFARPEKPKDYDVGAFVKARLPTALYADAEGTLPHTATILEEGATPIDPVAGHSVRDRAMRVAVVILAWNAIQHFSPIVDEARVDWEARLPVAIAAAASAKGERELLTVLRHMVAALGDGQARVDHRSDWRDSHIPIRWDWVDDDLVVTHVSPDERAYVGLGRGDAVERILDENARDVFDRESREFSGATPQRIEAQVLESMLGRRLGQPVKLRIRNTGGKKLDVNYTDEYARTLLPAPRPAQFAEVADGVRYVDLARVRETHLGEMLAAVEGAKAVVLDLRGGLHELGHRALVAHLVPKAVDGVAEHVPISTRPNRERLDWEEHEDAIEPAEPRLEAKLAFLVDGSVVGEAEAVAAVARAAKLGPIVGRTNGGTLGDTNAVDLPGGYRLQFTAVRAEPPGRLDVYGEGVEPDEPVERTLEGVKAGTDETLARALELLR